MVLYINTTIFPPLDFFFSQHCYRKMSPVEKCLPAWETRKHLTNTKFFLYLFYLQEFVTGLTFTKANCLTEMPTSSESSKILQQKSRGHRKIHSFSKRHKSCSNLLQDFKELRENTRRLSLKKHDREVQQLHDTLDMLGMVWLFYKSAWRTALFPTFHLGTVFGHCL